MYLKLNSYELKVFILALGSGIQMLKDLAYKANG